MWLPRYSVYVRQKGETQPRRFACNKDLGSNKQFWFTTELLIKPWLVNVLKAVYHTSLSHALYTVHFCHSVFWEKMGMWWRAGGKWDHALKSILPGLRRNCYHWYFARKVEQRDLDIELDKLGSIACLLHQEATAFHSPGDHRIVLHQGTDTPPLPLLVPDCWGHKGRCWTIEACQSN